MKKSTVISQVKGHTKVIASLLVGYGVGEIMGNVIKDYKPDAKGLKKALIKLGAIALTGMVVKEVCKFAEGEIDEVFDAVESVANGDDEDSDSDSEDEDDKVAADGDILCAKDKSFIDNVMTKMQDHIDKYGYATLIDLHTYFGVTDISDRHRWMGWKSLDGFRIHQTRSGYILDYPLAKQLPTYSC